jgi:hypothetical protein
MKGGQWRGVQAITISRRGRGVAFLCGEGTAKGGFRQVKRRGGLLGRHKSVSVHFDFTATVCWGCIGEGDLRRVRRTTCTPDCQLFISVIFATSTCVEHHFRRVGQ